MAVSYEPQWIPSQDTLPYYYPSPAESSYPAAYNVPTMDYNTQHQVPGFGDTMSQPYVREVVVSQAFKYYIAFFGMHKVLP